MALSKHFLRRWIMFDVVYAVYAVQYELLNATTMTTPIPYGVRRKSNNISIVSNGVNSVKCKKVPF